MSEEKPMNAGTDANPAEAKAPTIESLQAEAAQWKAKAEEYLELAKRAKADFINYQDRVRRDKADWNRQALEGFVREMLPAMDGFALAKFEDPKLLEAVRLLEKEFLRIFAKAGVTPIETAGKSFDPLYHEAVAMDPGGTQLEEVRRGWLLEGKVLRPASIKLVKPKE
jgi:molecular chaperone GrpE